MKVLISRKIKSGKRHQRATYKKTEHRLETSKPPIAKLRKIARKNTAVIEAAMNLPLDQRRKLFNMPTCWLTFFNSEISRDFIFSLTVSRMFFLSSVLSSREESVISGINALV